MQVFSGFFDLIDQYVGGNALYVFVIAAGLILICSLEQKTRKVAVLVAVLLILVVYNPLSYSMLTRLTGESVTYYRFLWLLPLHILLAFFVFEAIRKIRKLKMQLLTVCIVCMGIFCMSVTKEELLIPGNAYQIPLETLEVAAELEDLMEEDGADSVKIIADSYICNTLRQYDARICYDDIPDYASDPGLTTPDIYGVTSMLVYNRNDIPKKEVSSVLRSREIDYIVIGIGNDVSLTYMQQLGWQIVTTTSAYYILQYQEPVFTPDLLVAAGIETGSVEVIIPGLTEEYHFLCLADMHIVTENVEGEM